MPSQNAFCLCLEVFCDAFCLLLPIITLCFTNTALTNTLWLSVLLVDSRRQQYRASSRTAAKARPQIAQRPSRHYGGAISVVKRNSYSQIAKFNSHPNLYSIFKEFFELCTQTSIKVWWNKCFLHGISGKSNHVIISVSNLDW